MLVPGCGAGRLAYMLARSGFNVEASDCRCVVKLVVKSVCVCVTTSRPLIVGVCMRP